MNPPKAKPAPKAAIKAAHPPSQTKRKASAKAKQSASGPSAALPSKQARKKAYQWTDAAMSTLVSLV
ncbi:hypothetical protein HDU98_006101, partial [Podochytrium sp. JEL0797]